MTKNLLQTWEKCTRLFPILEHYCRLPEQRRRKLIQTKEQKDRKTRYPAGFFMPVSSPFWKHLVKVIFWRNAVGEHVEPSLKTCSSLRHASTWFDKLTKRAQQPGSGNLPSFKDRHTREGGYPTAHILFTGYCINGGMTVQRLEPAYGLIDLFPSEPLNEAPLCAGKSECV